MILLVRRRHRVRKRLMIKKPNIYTQVNMFDDLGTPINWPPEYLTQKKFDPCKETTWALGSVLFALVNGCRPYAGISHALSYPLMFYKDVSPG